MKILYVAYPLLPVTANSAGGSEQVLWTLEREVARRGHSTVVAASTGSQVAGESFSTGSTNDGDALDPRRHEHHERIIQRLQQEDFDLVHDHSGLFWREAQRVEVPVLATLHLARCLYKQERFESIPTNVSFNLVSESQTHQFADVSNVAGVVNNGIALDRFPFHAEKDDYLLWLGRVCEEKAPHLAVEIAEAAGMRIVLAGKVYPFRYHQDYFERQVKPLIDNRHVTYIDSPDFPTKVRLLQRARAVVIPSLVDETSSLVAMEAMACGSPVLALRRGALAEIVGEAGFVADSADELGRGVGHLERITPAQCREHVERRFCSRVMADGYEQLYARIVGQHMLRVALAA